MNIAAAHDEISLPDVGLGLYVHVPFCETKCGYCDFYSIALNGQDTGPLVDALCREIADRLDRITQSVVTCFCGGGTPTLLPPHDLARLLATIRERLDPARCVEFTVEANPATVDEAKAGILRDHGVTRVSLGAQSFDPAELAALERIHQPADIPASLDILRRAGLDNLNLDLIFGIPGQSVEAWAANLDRAVDLEPMHVSAYGLTYEPGTRLTAQRDRGLVFACDDAVEARMFERCAERLGHAGYAPYELSNYARPARACMHNVMYWRNRDYVGAGPSAVGAHDGRRYRNVPSAARYVELMRQQGHAEFESELIDDATMVIEIIMMQMRLTAGMDLDRLRRHLDPRDLPALTAKLESLTGQDLVELIDNRVRLSTRGRLFSNHVIRELVGAVP